MNVVGHSAAATVSSYRRPLHRSRDVAALGLSLHYEATRYLRAIGYVDIIVQASLKPRRDKKPREENIEL